ncbi:MAG TPA: hypothetical protein VEA58_01165 [Anaerovoracaceae bacterium]|nr:hypothetical protein [Anaerovoracaceae bacterium]
MRESRNIVPVVITACNIAVAVIFTQVETTGAFPESLDPYKGLIILYYFMSWITTLIMITVAVVIVVKNIAAGRVEIFPFPILFLNIGYLVYIWYLLYFRQ